MKAFRCSRTGVFFPADYVEEWGRKYGIGLGPVPVSEALVNDYMSKPVVSPEGKAMHPIGTCRAQVDLVEVTEEEFNKSKAVLASEDVSYNKRAVIMRDKQLVKSTVLRSIHPDEAKALDQKTAP